MSDSVMLTKAKAFAIRIVNLHKYLHETGFIPDGDSYQSLYTDCEELIRILVASIRTAKAN